MDPQVRVGDADRERTVAALQQYVSDGYLTLEEFEDRSAAAYRARTHGDLAAVTGDIAATEDPAPPARASQGASAVAPSGRRWSPVAVVVAVVVGVVAAVGVAMLVMMIVMMDGMGGMGGMR